jgi:hypothetical protein
MKIRFLQGAILRFTLCLVMLLDAARVALRTSYLDHRHAVQHCQREQRIVHWRFRPGDGEWNRPADVYLRQRHLQHPTQPGVDLHCRRPVAIMKSPTPMPRPKPGMLSTVGTTSGSLMQIWSYAGASNEEFEPVSLGSGYYKFVGQGSGLCLDVPGNSTANSVQLDIYTCNGTTAQAFKLVTPSASSGEGPYGGVAAAIPGTVMAENYDTGGQGVGYNVTSVNGTDNGYRPDGVDLETASAPATGNDDRLVGFRTVVPLHGQCGHGRNLHGHLPGCRGKRNLRCIPLYRTHREPISAARSPFPIPADGKRGRR